MTGEIIRKKSRRFLAVKFALVVTLLVECSDGAFFRDLSLDPFLEIEDLYDDLGKENRYTMVKESVDQLIHEGLYAHEHVHPDDYEVTVPTKVSRDGRFLSHQLEHHHQDSPLKRRKRDTSTTVESPSLHYNLTIGGRNVSLDLRPSHAFINPHLVVERHWSNVVTRDKPHEAANLCHYQGSVRGQRKSSVALSACHGLAGMVRTEDGEYWLEPSRQRQPGTERHPHVVYKRSAAVGTRAPQAPQRRRRRHRRRQRGGQNCGTHEPPFATKPYAAPAAGDRAPLTGNAASPRPNPLRHVTRPSSTPWQSPDSDVYVGRIHGGGKSVMDAARRTNPRPSRRPRSVSKERHVEVLIVADHSMIDFHERGKVETYLLTIMNIVSSLYMDPTIGNFINVVVVKIIMLEDRATRPPLDISVNADVTLANFCKWQRDLNRDTDDSQPNHHDVAILITRTDICAKQNSPCSTLGVAHVAGMCLPERSCSVNEDNGISLAHTITHELGHNFGMYHDTKKIGCERKYGSTLYVMTPIFDTDTVDVAWSNCSRRDVTNFLDSGLGECLNDQPAQLDYIYPEWPPGVLYNATEQCRLQFGTTGSVCSDANEVCGPLWCVVNTTCMTILKPQAPGTFCGPNMWCQNNKCVPESDKPSPVDGGWGSWSDWSICSRTCGAGISMQSRACSNPLPKHNGKFCTGERTKYKVCNTNACPPSRPSFREVQCSRHNNATLRWKPYYDQDEPCVLFCSSTEDVFMPRPFGMFAIDGTPCGTGKRDMCISGICKKIGCDWVVDSNATEDPCGLCNGDGSLCKTVKGIYNKSITKEGGYSEVAIIPAGSRNIKVEEASNTRNFIGLAARTTNRFYTNQERKNTSEYFAGSPIIYEMDRDLEKIKIPGPITEDIQVYQMLYTGRYRNPGVRYQYTIDRNPKYRWRLSGWSRCQQRLNKTCGAGLTRRKAICIQIFNRTNRIVKSDHCINNPNLTRPNDILKQCTTNRTCPYWWVDKWSLCTFSCALQNRNRYRILCRHVQCKDRTRNRNLPLRYCDQRKKPITQRRQRITWENDRCSY